MPQFLDIPNTLPFTELTTQVIDYIRPYRQVLTAAILAGLEHIYKPFSLLATLLHT
jgi:hypothetical protein